MRYLSEEWIQAADAAVKEAPTPPPGPGVVVDQVVDGALSYRITIAGDGPSIELVDADVDSPSADARFEQSLATATAVAQGSTDAHQAFLLGHIRFVGDVNVLIERRDVFEWLEAALAPLVAITTFSESSG